MVQLSKHKWRIETQNGTVIKDDVTVHSISEATEYIKRYISSYNDWDFNILPLKKREKSL